MIDRLQILLTRARDSAVNAHVCKDIDEALGLLPRRAIDEIERLRPARRDMFAAAALQGLMARGGDGAIYAATEAEYAAAEARRVADALIAELDQTEGASP